MATSTAFRAQSKTLTIAASTTSASSAWTGADILGDCLRIFNNTSAIAFVRTGNSRDGTITALVASDLPIAPNAVEVIGCNDSDDTFAVILLSGSGNVYVTKGQGI